MGKWKKKRKTKYAKCVLLNFWVYVILKMPGKPVKSLTRPDVGKPSISRDTVPAENEGSSSEDEYPPRASQGDGSQNMSSQRSDVSGLSADESQKLGESQPLDASPESTTEPMIIAIENQLLEPIGEHADESDDVSIATGISQASINSIQSLADSKVSFANSLASASETSFTMAPSADALLEDFYNFWNEHPDIGYTAVMVAFISFAYSNGIKVDAITSFFNKINPGLNLRLGGTDITAVIRDSVQPGKSAGGSGIINGITNGIRAIATAAVTSVATVIGTNMVVEEPLTITNVTDLFFEFGEFAMDAVNTVPDFISLLEDKVAKLKALYKIKNIARDAEGISNARRIQNAIEEAAGVLNAASDADRRRRPLSVVDLRSQVAAIITTLKSSPGVGATAPGAGASAPGPSAPGAGSGAKRGGKRQSQKQQQQKKQKQQKKTQKQQKKLSKSKRAKKEKQSKKANKKH